MAIHKIIIKDVHGRTISIGNFAAMETAEVLLTGGVGTPSANVDYADGVMTLTLNNIKGNGIVGIEQVESSEEQGGINRWVITEANGNQTGIAIRNGWRGPRGLQGPKGDTVILGAGREYTLYGVPGSNSDGAMTQEAVTNFVNGRFQFVASQEDMESMIAQQSWEEGIMYYTVEED